MKVFSMLFSLLVACQALPITMHAAAAQADDDTQAVGAEMTRAAMEQFDPVRLRNEYNFAVSRLKSHDGKPRAYTYDVVTDTTMALAGGSTTSSGAAAMISLLAIPARQASTAASCQTPLNPASGRCKPADSCSESAGLRRPLAAW